jgi:hypothetical protein
MPQSTSFENRAKVIDTLARWVGGIVCSIIAGALFISKMRYDVDGQKSSLDDHSAAIKLLEHNDAVNAQKIDGIFKIVDRIDRKLDK